MRNQMIAISSMAMIGMLVFGAKSRVNVTKIEFPRQKRLLILPGVPDVEGNFVVAVPPKTPFAVLHDVDLGDEIVVDVANGEPLRYRVRSMRVIAESNTAIRQDFGDRRLTLITNYPMDESLRYAVVATASDRMAR